MDVMIEEVVSNVRVVDSAQMIDPATMARIVAAVMAELARQDALKAQRASDRAPHARPGQRR